VDDYEKNGGILLKEELGLAAAEIATQMVQSLKK